MQDINNTIREVRQKTPVSRRRFLIGGSVLLLNSSLLSRADFPANPDVVVIGAGAAGIAAGKTILESGRTVAIIEAADRIGGRVVSDTSTFGIPYDAGAHWLHYGETNPFLKYGEDNGFTMYKSPADRILYIGSRPATKEEYATFESAEDNTYAAIEKAGQRGKDVSPASVVPNIGEWHDTVHLAVGPYEMAKDYDHFSCQDWFNSEDGTDYYCKEGFGALFAHSAKDVPVRLSAKAEKIKWGGQGVSIETTQGDLSAKACIVTVSTGVLANEEIHFDPPLPLAKQESFHGISMGIYNHIALQFRQNFFGINEDGYLLYKINSTGAKSSRGMITLVNASGGNLSYADVGGEFARALEKEGRAASIDFALSELRKIFGSEVDRQFIKADATAWGLNPLFHGSYASAEPGKYKMRSVLKQPVGERIFFAGEALSEDDWATVAGAHKSGVATAESVLSAMG